MAQRKDSTPTRIKSRLALLFLTAWLLPALACNYPGLLPPQKARQPGLPSDALRATLMAQGVPTDQLPLLETPLPTPPSGIQPSPFPGLSTATPGLTLPGEAPAEAPDTYHYLAQSGDTLSVLARRFDVDPALISSPDPLQPNAYLFPGQLLYIPNTLGDTPYPSASLPDSEVIYSPSASDLDLYAYIQSAGGALSRYSEPVDGETLSGAAIVQRVAIEASINPRLLLSFLEFRSGMVLGPLRPGIDPKYPIGFRAPGYKGLYLELVVTGAQINAGYYGWRLGTLTELKYRDGETVRISPELNPGTVAVQHLLAKLYEEDQWLPALYGADSLTALHTDMFGDPWARAAAVEPLITPGVVQPALELPFQPGERWSFTGGPHAAWNTTTPLGAVDFSPVTGEPACSVSRAWATAAAGGIIARSANGVVTIDLDGDGDEGTGWVLMYMHVAEQDRIAAGSLVRTDMPIGHPSCERGKATGTHVHLARKYNGEWLPVDGPLSFVLSGWTVRAGPRPYGGTLNKGNEVVSANPGGPRTSIIVR